ncbi:MAG: hypothetical protein KIT19_09945 [Phycisphaeraceae bacterium]|nr:hypothetical protein [Phycisphaeraceae bacterium]
MKGVSTIFVALVNEGADCWRPIEASLQNDGSYLISGTVPESEEWEFAPGVRVVCEQRMFDGGELGLVAVRQVG